MKLFLSFLQDLVIQARNQKIAFLCLTNTQGGTAIPTLLYST